jgi:hypothetical protein
MVREYAGTEQKDKVTTVAYLAKGKYLYTISNLDLVIKYYFYATLSTLSLN